MVGRNQSASALSRRKAFGQANQNSRLGISDQPALCDMRVPAAVSEVMPGPRARGVTQSIVVKTSQLQIELSLKALPNIGIANLGVSSAAAERAGG